ncbi:hypothetical protein ASG54_10435 [Aureimonas sp. Leaf460]|nr:hypothetical protein ASG62_07840 [Aureimonas sp. Leaf427]KQT79419.1 hypothetical protein ASG54_10435 [Aureimonas sp. Leaf460]
MIRAIYRPMSAAFAAFAVLLIALALGPVADGERWGSLAATGVSFVLGIPTTFGTWTFERRTGIRAPYRLSAAMKGLSVVAMARSW